MAMATAAAVALWGCGSSEDEPLQTVFGGDRPVELHVPIGHDPDTPAPLLLVLHGYSVTGGVELAYSRLDKVIDTEGVLVLAPDGTIDPDGNLFWNVDNTGCLLGGSGSLPDDTGYLIGLIDEVAAVYSVDPNRVYVFGHSNGGFMAYRLACNHADRIAAIVSLAGAPALDELDCSPSEAVSVLQIHGDADDTVLFGGGNDIIGLPCPYPGAEESAARWAAHDSCAATRDDPGVRLDLDSGLDGDETRVDEHASCDAGFAVELWTIAGGAHIPSFRNDVHVPIWTFLADHPKP
jgi:polyhydroxybutyrate depolymerase